MKNEIVLILVTVPNLEEAEQIADTLVKEHLIACCNITRDITSIFHWKGEICREKEYLLLIKSVRKNLDKIIDQIKNLHSYQVPEIIALPVIAGNNDYFKWVKEESW